MWLQMLTQLQHFIDLQLANGNRAAFNLASAVVASFMLTAMLPQR